MIVPVTLSTIVLVKLKNFKPESALLSLPTSSLKRLASKHHDSRGIDLKTIAGLFDSSLTLAEYSVTANVRPIRKTSEYQK
jgi:hypothetical protein